MKPIHFIVSAALSVLLLGCATQDATTHKISQATLQTGANQDWPSFGGDYANQRFSANQQINRDNVKDLGLAWQFKSGVKAAFQATPIVVGGVMYVSLPFNHVVALDAKTGKELWRYQHQRRMDWNMCCGPANRGVAVGNGM